MSPRESTAEGQSGRASRRPTFSLGPRVVGPSRPAGAGRRQEFEREQRVSKGFSGLLGSPDSLASDRANFLTLLAFRSGQSRVANRQHQVWRSRMTGQKPRKLCHRNDFSRLNPLCRGRMSHSNHSGLTLPPPLWGRECLDLGVAKNARNATIPTLDLSTHTRDCPACGLALWAANRPQRTVVTLEGLVRLRHQIRNRRIPQCSRHRACLRPEPEGASPCRSTSFGLDVISGSARCVMPLRS